LRPIIEIHGIGSEAYALLLKGAPISLLLPSSTVALAGESIFFVTLSREGGVPRSSVNDADVASLSLVHTQRRGSASDR
jgi:hypothetical protein